MTNSPGTPPEKPLDPISNPNNTCSAPSVPMSDWTSSLRASSFDSSGLTSTLGKRVRTNENHETRDFSSMDKSDLISLIKSLQEQNLLLTRCLADARATTSYVPEKTSSFTFSSTSKSKWASADSLQSHSFPPLPGKSSAGNTTSAATKPKSKNVSKSYSSVTQTAPTTLPKPAKKPTAKAKQWAARLFSSPDSRTTSDSGYTFVYLPSNKRTTYAELRERIKLIGVNLTRIYSLGRPAKHVVSVLVHKAYAKELNDKFIKAGITPLLNFNPTCATTLGDPRLLETLKSDKQREDKAKSIYYNSLLRATVQLRDSKLGLHILNCFNKLDCKDRHYVPEVIVQQFLKLKPDAVKAPRPTSNRSSILGGFDAANLFDSLEGAATAITPDDSQVTASGNSSQEDSATPEIEDTDMINGDDNNDN